MLWLQSGSNVVVRAIGETIGSIATILLKIVQDVGKKFPRILEIYSIFIIELN